MDAAGQALCLLNPHANLGRSLALFESLKAELEALSPGVRLAMPKTAEEGRALIAALPPGSRVIIGGGDGSSQQYLQAVMEGRHTLGLIALGTGNDFAQALGVKKLHWREALRLALQGEPQPMDVGEVCFTDNSKSFFASSLACGFDAAAGMAVAQVPRFFPGKLRYAMAVLRQMLSLRDYGVYWRMNQEGPWLQEKLLLSSCLNTPTYGSGMPLAPRADVWDGQLDLMQLQSTGLLGTLVLFVRLLAGGLHEGSRKVSHWRCEQLEIVSSDGQPLPLLLDGEEVGEWAQVRVRPGALQVVPKPVCIKRQARLGLV